MKNLQKMGGIAALYEAAAYIVAMVGFLLIVDVAGVMGFLYGYPVTSALRAFEGRLAHNCKDGDRLRAYLGWSGNR